MCVRTLVGNEMTSEPVVRAPSESKHSNRLSRAKEKYMKLHDEMLEKEKLARRQQRAEKSFYLPDLADDVLAASTVHYSLLLMKLAKYYQIVRRSKAFK